MAYDWLSVYDEREEQIKKDIIAEMKDLFLGKKIKIFHEGEVKVITLVDINWEGIHQKGPHFIDEERTYHSKPGFKVELAEE
jgi:hypothetical protein